MRDDGRGVDVVRVGTGRRLTRFTGTNPRAGEASGAPTEPAPSPPARPQCLARALAGELAVTHTSHTDVE
jgi:hypothetical protein